MVGKIEDMRTFLIYDTSKEATEASGEHIEINNPVYCGIWQRSVAFSKDLLILIYTPRSYNSGVGQSIFNLRFWPLNVRTEDLQFMDVPLPADHAQITQRSKVLMDYLPRASALCMSFSQNESAMVLGCWRVSKTTLQVTQVGLTSIKYLTDHSKPLKAGSIPNDLQPSFFESKRRIFCFWMRISDWRIYSLYNQNFVPVSLGSKFGYFSQETIIGLPCATDNSKFSLYFISPLPLPENSALLQFEVYRMMLKW